jgi:hypothetical protein
MPAARNISKEIYVALVQGLLGDPDWPVLARNFKHYDVVEGDQDPEELETDAGDYPQAILEGPLSGNTDLQSGDVTFATYSDDPPPDWLETSTEEYELTVLSDQLGLDVYSPLAMESINAVRRLGAKLGLPYVTKATASFKQTENRDSETGSRQITVKIKITVSYQIDGSQLTGGTTPPESED